MRCQVFIYFWPCGVYIYVYTHTQFIACNPHTVCRVIILFCEVPACDRFKLVNNGKQFLLVLYSHV
uniref:Uncharacterized protein n=1 Tax=Anguilla anguilla TaxID=7936 RepID=A0A0E9WHS4_ANGAN